MLIRSAIRFFLLGIIVTTDSSEDDGIFDDEFQIGGALEVDGGGVGVFKLSSVLMASSSSLLTASSSSLTRSTSENPGGGDVGAAAVSTTAVVDG